MTDEPTRLRIIEIGSEAAGRRLDRFLADGLAVSRGEIRSLLVRGVVRLNGRVVGERDKGRILLAGGRLEVADFQPAREQRATANPELAAVLSVLARGEGWLAVAKPPGVGVHPLSPDQHATVLNAIAHEHPEVHGVGEGGLRSGVVHRLDVDTSGALLVGTRQPAWQRLRGAFARHLVAKCYRAVVVGAMTDDVEVEVALRVARHRPARVEVVEVAGSAELGTSARMTSLTVHPLARLSAATLVEVRPKTGFLHQIRATLAHLGHPVMGDTAYGAPAPPAFVERQLLHAASLHFEEIAVTCPDAADFAAALNALG